MTSLRFPIKKDRDSSSKLAGLILASQFGSIPSRRAIPINGDKENAVVTCFSVNFSWLNIDKEIEPTAATACSGRILIGLFDKFNDSKMGKIGNPEKDEIELWAIERLTKEGNWGKSLNEEMSQKSSDNVRNLLSKGSSHDFNGFKFKFNEVIFEPNFLIASIVNLLPSRSKKITLDEVGDNDAGDWDEKDDNPFSLKERKEAFILVIFDIGVAGDPGRYRGEIGDLLNFVLIDVWLINHL